MTERTWLFLDIDGVLNGGYLPKIGFDWHLPSAIDALNRLTDALNADIIVSSSWRTAHSLRELQHTLAGWGVKASVVGVTPILGDKPRINEIWVALEQVERRSWVILDDNDVYEEDFRGSHSERSRGDAWRFYQTTTLQGLTLRDVDLILERWKMNEPSESPILAFYYGRGNNDAGKSFSEMIEASDETLEQSHDFIQWLFPLPEPSQWNPNAQILRPEDIQAFRESELLQLKMQLALNRMRQFFLRTSSWRRRSFNHNHLRITRILRSLTVLGQPETAREFLSWIEETAFDCFEDSTRRYWSEALNETPAWLEEKKR